METDLFQDKSVLIVDDDPDVLTALSSAFTDQGAAVTTAQDGHEAIVRAEADSPDLIVLDAMLPKRSGFLVLEKLKRKKNEPGAPRVIMITGNDGKRHQTWAQSLGVDAYFNKPFRLDRLMESAEQLLDGNGDG
jgi:DNA-binding response OmpR family regulator